MSDGVPHEVSHGVPHEVSHGVPDEVKQVHGIGADKSRCLDKATACNRISLKIDQYLSSFNK